MPSARRRSIRRGRLILTRKIRRHDRHQTLGPRRHLSLSRQPRTLAWGESAAAARASRPSRLTRPRPSRACARSFFGGSQEAGYQRFRTTSQNFYEYDTKALSVGESNQGIVSEKSKNIHKQQLM